MLGKTETILASAAAHHRRAWIHPFLDSNGRVARLMSHATLLEALDTGAVWSVARGLARNVDVYKGHHRRNRVRRQGNSTQPIRSPRARRISRTTAASVMKAMMQCLATRMHIMVANQGLEPRTKGL